MEEEEEEGEGESLSVSLHGADPYSAASVSQTTYPLPRVDSEMEPLDVYGKAAAQSPPHPSRPSHLPS